MISVVKRSEATINKHTHNCLRMVYSSSCPYLKFHFAAQGREPERGKSDTHCHPQHYGSSTFIRSRSTTVTRDLSLKLTSTASHIPGYNLPCLEGIRLSWNTTHTRKNHRVPPCTLTHPLCDTFWSFNIISGTLSLLSHGNRPYRALACDFHT